MYVPFTRGCGIRCVTAPSLRRQFAPWLIVGGLAGTTWQVRYFWSEFHFVAPHTPARCQRASRLGTGPQPIIQRGRPIAEYCFQRWSARHHLIITALGAQRDRNKERKKRSLRLRAAPTCTTMSQSASRHAPQQVGEGRLDHNKLWDIHNRIRIGIGIGIGTGEVSCANYDRHTGARSRSGSGQTTRGVRLPFSLVPRPQGRRRGGAAAEQHNRKERGSPDTRGMGELEVWGGRMRRRAVRKAKGSAGEGAAGTAARVRI